jgi:hypothetical protein
MKRNRFTVVIAIITTIVLGLGSAASAHDDDGWQVTVNRFPVSYTVTAARCNYLDPGISATGSGEMVSITKERTNRAGVVQWQNSSSARGTATDNQGNSYRFKYDNDVRETSTDGVHFTGIMKDAFSQNGRGPARLHNGFVAFIEETHFTSFAATPLSSFGDPFDFVNLSNRCDPL